MEKRGSRHSGRRSSGSAGYWSAAAMEKRGYRKCPYCGRRLVDLERHVESHREGLFGPDGRRTDRSPEEARRWAQRYNGAPATERFRRSAGSNARASDLADEIPQRVLRNEVSKVLADVAAGRRFRVTVSGRPVAELVPLTQPRTWVPWQDAQRIVREHPLDPDFLKDVAFMREQTVDEQ